MSHYILDVYSLFCDYARLDVVASNSELVSCVIDHHTADHLCSLSNVAQHL